MVIVTTARGSRRAHRVDTVVCSSPKCRVPGGAGAEMKLLIFVGVRQGAAHFPLPHPFIFVIYTMLRYIQHLAARNLLLIATTCLKSSDRHKLGAIAEEVWTQAQRQKDQVLIEWRK